MLVATCPSREELLDYAVGKLSDEAADSLAGHLESCENCQAELAALPDADDSLVARLRGPLTPDPYFDEPECTVAVAIAREVAENDASATNLPRLLGEYQLSAKLGSGGMGTVYKALHTKLGRVVALKVLTRARTHDPAAVARFEREMQAVGQLDHRHIVRAHDAREIDGTPILVMEYLDGLDLGEIVRRAGVPALAGNLPSPSGRGAGGEGGGRLAPCISVPDAAELARQTAIGLQTIHEHGLVHRDIKPSNLMLTADGEVKILDLGLARLRPDVPPGEEMTATGQGMGTADYMAPEQASDSRAVDIRADIYSLGCTLYKLLTSRAPFSGPDYCTAFDKMTAHVNKSAPPVRSLAPNMPEGLAAIVERMLAKNPADRFATPSELADTLSPYCTGANLPALLERAKASPPRPPIDGRSEGGSGLPSPSGRGAGGEGHRVAHQPAAQSHRWKRFVLQLVLLALVGGLGYAAAIIIRVQKDGKETTVTVNKDGDVDVKLSENTGPAASAQVPPTRFRMATVTRGDLTATVKATGTIEPEEVVDVAARVEGRYVKFGDDPRGKTDPNFKGKAVDINTPVDVGTVLAELDPIYYKAERDQAAADVDKAKAGLKSAEIRVAYAKNGNATEPLPLCEAALDAAKAAVAKAQAGLDLAQTALDRTVIRSPVRGTIIERDVNIGENVSPDGRQFRIAKDTDKLQILVSDLAYDNRPVARGMDVHFSVDAFPREVFSGKVSHIRPNVPDFGNQTVVVAIDKADRRLMPYMTANVNFQVEARRNVLRVPSAALRYRARPEQIVPEARAPITSRKGAVRPGFLWVTADDGIHLRPVEVECGVSDGTLTEVSGAEVKEGTEVVIGELVGGIEAGSFVPKPFRKPGESGASEKTHTAAPLPTVRVTQPVICDVRDNEEYTGRIEGGVVNIPMPSGEFEKTYFKEGMTVHEGDLLCEIVPYNDPKVRQAEEAADAAHSALIDAKNGKDAKRIAKAEGEWKVAREAAEQTKRDQQRVKVLAPISGRLGGFSDGGSRIHFSSITSPDSMIVVFDIDERAVLAHRRLPNRKPNWELSLPVECGLADDKGFPYRGKVISVAEAIDPNTHTQRWEAIIPNKDGIFVPGMSVRVRVITSEPHKVLAVPPSVAFEYLPDEGHENDPVPVKILNNQNVIETRMVKFWEGFDIRGGTVNSVNFRGQIDGGLLGVVKGLSTNDWVVLSGDGNPFESHLRVGDKVTPEKITTPPPPSAATSKSAPPGNEANPNATRGESEQVQSAAPLPVVRVTQPVVCNVCDYEQYTGQIGGNLHMTVQAPVKGMPVCLFKSGMMVKKGDVLAEIVSKDDWTKLEAAGNALNLLATGRSGMLGRGGRGGRGRMDQSDPNAEEQWKSAVAEWNRARGNTKTVKVLAPCSGTSINRNLELQRGGSTREEFDPGTPICQIASSDSMVVTFDVPESAVLKHRRLPDRKPDWEKSLHVVFGLADDKGFPYRGSVLSVDETINGETHAQRWQAVVPNKDGIFMPGMSVRLRLITSEPHKVMLVPNSASIHHISPFNEDRVDAELDIVNNRDTIESRKVSMGRNYKYDGFVAIKEGLNANDWVAIQELRSGMGAFWNAGETVKLEKITTPPPPWAAISVPPSVTVARPIAREVTDYQDFTGHIEAAQTAEIRARASGTLDKVCFKPGMPVKKGDVLFEIDPRLYQAELDQAAGGVKQAQIRLNARKLDFDRKQVLARKLDFDRKQVLAKNKAVTQEEIDQVKSDRDAAEAAVQTAEAAVNVARVRLEYTRITAPFAGNIGRSLLDAGNLVTADKTVLATLTSTDPMYVYFDVDERTALVLRRNTAKDPGIRFAVACGLPGEDGFPHQSKVESAEGRINPATGTLSLRAVLPNKDGLLLPGMFVRVRLAINAPYKALVVPEKALGSDQGHRFVFVIGDQNVAERRDVEPGPMQDDEMRAVTRGLTTDDWVCTSGLRQLKPGTTVTPEKSEMPAK